MHSGVIEDSSNSVSSIAFSYFGSPPGFHHSIVYLFTSRHEARSEFFSPVVRSMQKWRKKKRLFAKENSKVFRQQWKVHQQIFINGNCIAQATAYTLAPSTSFQTNQKLIVPRSFWSAMSLMDVVYPTNCFVFKFCSVSLGVVWRNGWWFMNRLFPKTNDVSDSCLKSFIIIIANVKALFNWIKKIITFIVAESSY